MESLVDTLTVVCRCVATSQSNDCVIPLGGCLMQFLACQHDEVTGLVRSTLRIVRKAFPGKIGAVYSHSMQVAYENVQDEQGAIDELGQIHFLDLCKKIAQMFVTSHAASTRSCVIEVFTSGVDYGTKVSLPHFDQVR